MGSRVAHFRLACLFWLAVVCQASPALDILFVGNSFTHGNSPPVLNYNAAAITDANGTGHGGVPGIFRKLAAEGGFDGVEVTIEAMSGSRLEQHYQNKQAVLGQAWDWVVLQELSTRPLVSFDNGDASTTGDLANFRAMVSNLRDVILQASPAASILLYQTWARPDLVALPPATPNPAQPYSELDAMQAELRAAYSEAAEDFELHGWAPVGDAFMRAVTAGVGYDERQNTSPPPAAVPLWHQDNYHASHYGSYLAACVFYARILGADPRELPLGAASAAGQLGIESAAARNLQTVAYEIIADAPPAVVRQPLARVVFAGSDVEIDVSVAGRISGYLWRHNGVAIPGATSSTLKIPKIRGEDAGYYDVVIANPAGQPVVSQPATVTIATGSQTRTVYIDLGYASNGTPPPWNNVSPFSRTVADLTDSDGEATGIGLEVSGGAFSASGGMPAMSGDAASEFGGDAASACGDYLYLSGTALGRLQFVNLNEHHSYRLALFASRDGGGVRSTRYTLAADQAADAALDAAYNSGQIAVFDAVTPDSANAMQLSLTKASGNSVNYAYLNAVAIRESIPIASSYALWTSAQGLPYAELAEDADPDGDGMVNFLEFALAGDPLLAESGILPVGSCRHYRGQMHLTMQLSKNPQADGISYLVEVSSDLALWNSGPGFTMTVVDNPETLLVMDSRPVLLNSRRFMRLTVSRD